MGSPATFFLPYIFFALVWITFAIIAQFAVALFVAEDAVRTNRKAVLWGVLAFFFSFLAIAIYFWTRRENQELLKKIKEQDIGRKVVIWILGLFTAYVIFIIIFFVKLMAMIVPSGVNL